MPADTYRYLKVVLIGDEHAGKILLLHHYTKLPIPDYYVPAVWTHFSSEIAIDRDLSKNKVIQLLPPIEKEDDPLKQAPTPAGSDRHLQSLWNTPDSHEARDIYSIAVREYSCYQASCIMLMFSIQSIASFGRAQYQFYQEILHDDTMSQLPIVVVGTHSEFRQCQTRAQRFELCKRQMAKSYDVKAEPYHYIDEFAMWNDSDARPNLVTYKEASEWVHSIGAKYIECSLYNRHNINESFHLALCTGLEWQQKTFGVGHECEFDANHPPPISAAGTLKRQKSVDYNEFSESAQLQNLLMHHHNMNLPDKRPHALVRAAQERPSRGLQGFRPPAAVQMGNRYQAKMAQDYAQAPPQQHVQPQQQRQIPAASRSPTTQQQDGTSSSGTAAYPHHTPAPSTSASSNTASLNTASTSVSNSSSNWHQPNKYQAANGLYQNQSIVPTATNTPTYEKQAAYSRSPDKPRANVYKHDSKRFNPDGSPKSLCCVIQ